MTDSSTASNKLRNAALWFWREWGKPILLALIVVLPLRSSIADWYDVPTGSMNPTIIEGDRVLVNKLAYDLKLPFTTRHLAQWNNPRRGDVVVFYSPADNVRLVKRVVGLPGDTLWMTDNRLVVNGIPVDYKPMSPDPFRAEFGDKINARQFFEEALPGRDHTVMFIPGAGSMKSFGRIIVPRGSYFMMGDNRDNSADSRYIGFVSRDRVVGRVSRVAFSLNYDHHHLPRWDRFFHRL
jgi:signal peptidase I